jgi:hypothetical protein
MLKVLALVRALSARHDGAAAIGYDAASAFGNASGTTGGTLAPRQGATDRIVPKPLRKSQNTL